MVDKLTKDVQMVGRIYMKPDGVLYQKYGAGDWFKHEFSKIPPESALYKQIVSTYGTKKGKTIRFIAMKRLFDKGNWNVG